MLSPATLVTDPFLQMKATLRSAREEGALKARGLPALGEPAGGVRGTCTSTLAARVELEGLSRMVLSLVALWEAAMRVSTP